MRLRMAGWLTAAAVGMSLWSLQGLAQDAAVTGTDQGGAQSTPMSTPAGQAEPAAAIAPAGPAVAEQPQPAQADAAPAVSLDSVRAAFEKRFPEIDVAGVRTTPFPGLYEIQLGKDVIYADAAVDYIMQGSLIDAKNRVDLTAARLEDLSKIAFSSLPLELAVKQVKGDGSRSMAIFEDPNCGYCKQLHHTLKNVDNVTIYTFLFPILTPDSTVKARDVWCADDPAATWTAWMVNGKKPPEAQCATPIDKVLALGRKLMVQGTPAIFFSDGSRINGALPLKALNEKLDTLKG